MVKKQWQCGLAIATTAFLSSIGSPMALSHFHPANLKEGKVESLAGKTIPEQIDDLPADIEALDLMCNAWDFKDGAAEWSQLKRFRKLKWLELGGPEYHLDKKFCALYDLPIESLYVRTDTIDREVTEQMHKLKHLKRLGLVVHFEFHPEEFLHFADIAKIETLEELKSSCKTSSDIDQLKKCPNLRSVELAMPCKLALRYAEFPQLEQICLEPIYFQTPEEIKKVMESIATLPRLKNLDACEQPLLNEAAEPLSKVLTLERLNLRDSPVTDKSMAHLKSLSNLRALNLRGTKITDACFEDLSALKSLEELDLLGSKTSGLGLKYFKGSRLKRLTMSAINNANLAFVPDLPELQYLNLEGAMLTELGAKHLARCANLISIRLGTLPPEKEKRLSILTELAKIKSLRQVTNKYLEPEFDQELKSVLPDCTSEALSPELEALLKPLILDERSHDITYAFGCFRED